MRYEKYDAFFGGGGGRGNQDGVEVLWFDVCAQLHMLGDGSRGSVIEMTLAKVLYISSKSRRFTG